MYPVRQLLGSQVRRRRVRGHAAIDLQATISIMSVSPPKETDVEPAGAPSPDTSEHMDRGDPEGQARELAYEFEVKEQDRWLPIANGWFLSCSEHLPIISALFFPSTATVAWREAHPRSLPYGVASGTFIHQMRF